MTIGEFRSRCEQLEVELKAVRQDLCGVLEARLIETLGSLKGDVSSSADALKRQEEIAAARERGTGRSAPTPDGATDHEPRRRLRLRSVGGVMAEQSVRAHAAARSGVFACVSGKSFAFGEWAYQWEEAEHTRLLEEQMQRESELLSTKALVGRAGRIRKECEVKLAAKDVELRVALERQKIELVGTAEEREKLHEQQAGRTNRPPSEANGAADYEPRHRDVLRRLGWGCGRRRCTPSRGCDSAPTRCTPGLYRGFEQWFTHSEEVESSNFEWLKSVIRLGWNTSSQVSASSGLSRPLCLVASIRSHLTQSKNESGELKMVITLETTSSPHSRRSTTIRAAYCRLRRRC